ncbi:DUF63 family protein [Natronobacterium gregoryi]|uniref:DUF63 domain-containing protein n=2 Tax=Natronobacterium gregoryi TaxID=44930 RepID=L0AEU3_NATGS|nr:DUF63 family protein [Natronobacterium gregoryi]AFZ72361.1 putative membrane protein [Natronobacterium gregoryi SP2]ELY64254.1 hypothetical protein C490_14735 [Natronobacterium gregoryi SP2]PLK20324.1 DUF63 domain-containing protein [Natronobacterium gregoryi SP2]SFJ22377.1 Uncharacterized membrane protein [Natronobacterium gregoryi]
MVLPEGFVLPPWYLLVPILAVLGGVLALLWELEPPVTDRTVVAFVPWMLFGATLHVLYRTGAYPETVEVLFTSPGVYLITAIVAGAAWILGIFLQEGGLQPTSERVVGITGTGFFAVFAMLAIGRSWGAGTFEPFWPVIAVVASGIVTALAWLALGLWFTDVAATTGATGALVVFGHTLDGISTAIGYDVLGAGEEVPLSRMILETGSALPTAEYIGGGWLFVLVKVGLALAILGLFREYVEEAPRQARTILALVAAIGLGPGVHNTLLFVVA